MLVCYSVSVSGAYVSGTRIERDYFYFGLVSRIKEIDNHNSFLSPASPKQQMEVN